jgi:hypothetical protein
MRQLKYITIFSLILAITGLSRAEAAGRIIPLYVY